MANPLRKGLSLPLPRSEGHPNDYRLWGNRELVRDQSQTKWVKFMVHWAELQRGYQPPSRADSWRQLNTAPDGAAYLRRLDRMVKAANDDGVSAMVTIGHLSPTWANGATGSDPFSSKVPEAKVPLDLSTDGPWAWFVSHLLARYKRGAAPNPVGPHEPTAGENTAGYDPRAGNPEGAFLQAVEIANEPNLLVWPQESLHQRVADMVRSSEALSVARGGQWILAPGTLDSPDPTDSYDPRRSTDWETFTTRTLDALSGFSPRVYVGWSQHNYRDVAREVSKGSSRARAVIDLLYDKSLPTGDPKLFLTESGFNMGSRHADPATRDAQAQRIYRNFLEMRDQPEVFLWTQHLVNDVTGNSFKSALRDDFIVDPAGPGAKRPSWDTWRLLPGSDVP